ncbi:hypothetical protein AAZX31_17G223700 [Glycine max]|uniref:Uncharacterized protein n=1 Tax=Glycine max TaxID=3847 RepID=K7MNL6_SOYBN|nr:hypothetical protein JHK86_048534 [Glycine max]KAG4934324.1 hypothetical protein JHK87_048326 [Glycine soja]KAG5098829.1 hypothetical protein JHK82_048683 [Glycine max]KRH05599.1 hypothetical protein GLYMA_17G236000v4 [Glycine max]
MGAQGSAESMDIDELRVLNVFNCLCSGCGGARYIEIHGNVNSVWRSTSLLSMSWKIINFLFFMEQWEYRFSM